MNSLRLVASALAVMILVASCQDQQAQAAWCRQVDEAGGIELLADGIEDSGFADMDELRDDLGEQGRNAVASVSAHLAAVKPGSEFLSAEGAAALDRLDLLTAEASEALEEGARPSLVHNILFDEGDADAQLIGREIGSLCS